MVKARKTRGGGSLTREQFLLREIRIVAALRLQGLTDADIMARVEEQNLFQYPNTTDIRRITRACLYRLTRSTQACLVSPKSSPKS